ncbi:MAG: hypothetical protein IKJ95_08655 [Bacteroidaceae bacterium]|nr:hypothetical protein [Bacteroidaceae bacterium]
MGNIKKISSIILSALLLAGCYSDKGNYDYALDTMNEITSVTFTPSVVISAEGDVIEVQQALEEDDRTRRIDAIVEQSLAKNLEELDFYWCRSYTNENGKYVKDTIISRGFLEFDLPVGKPMSYDIFLQIYDRSTTLSHYSSFRIKTRPVFKNSLFVMHGGEGSRKIGNIEVIGNETKIYTDVKSVTRDNNHYADAMGFGYTTYINIPEDLANIGETNALTVYGSNGGTRAYDPHGMRVKFTAQQLMKPESENFRYRKTVQTGDPSNYTQYKVVLTDDGEAYIGNYVHALYKPGYGCENNTDLPHESDYEITAAAITHNRFLFWDAKNSRFLYSAKQDPGFAIDEANSIKPTYISMSPVLDANVKFQGLQKSPEGMTAIMGYINYRDSYDQQNPYFIFKDESTGEYYRYELLMQNIGDGSKIKRTRSAGDEDESEKLSAYTVISEKKLTGLTPDNDATITYNSWFTTTNLFFAEGNKVYRYNVSNGDKFVVYEAPEGYNVTMIKFRTEDSSSFSGDLGLYMNIALYNGTNGAVAEIKFNTAADVDAGYPPLFYDKDNEGNLWGEIKDLQFVNEYMYKIDY